MDSETDKNKPETPYKWELLQIKSCTKLGISSAARLALCHTLLHYRSAPISWYHCAAFWGCLVRQPPCHVGEF